MILEKHPRPKRSSVDGEEERAWIEFYRRVRTDADLAAEVLAQLERDPEMKRRHLALCLSCKESLRRFKARQVRHKRIAWFLRRLVDVVLVRPWQGVRSLGGQGRDIAIDLLPQPVEAPRSTTRSQKLAHPTGPSGDGGDVSVGRRVQTARQEASATSGDGSAVPATS